MVIMVPGITMAIGGHIPFTIPIRVIITEAGTTVEAGIITAAYTTTLITEPVPIVKAEWVEAAIMIHKQAYIFLQQADQTGVL